MSSGRGNLPTFTIEGLKRWRKDVDGAIRDLRQWRHSHSDTPTQRGGNKPYATVVVAAVNSTAADAANADFQCDGTADEVTVKAAWTAAGGGRVLLLEGAYSFAAAPSGGQAEGLWVDGQGPGTIIRAAAGFTGTLLTMAVTDGRVSNLTLDGDGLAATCLALNGWRNRTSGLVVTGPTVNGVIASYLQPLISDVHVLDSAQVGINVQSASDAIVHGCEVRDCVTSGIRSSGATTASLIVANRVEGCGVGITGNGSGDMIVANKCTGNTTGVDVDTGADEAVVYNDLRGNTTAFTDGGTGTLNFGNLPSPVFDGAAAVATHEADASDAHDASAVSIADAGAHFTGTDVEAALQELGAGGGGHPDLAAHDTLGLATQTELDDHLNDASDAHDASAVSVADAGAHFTGTDVEAVLQEIGAAGGGHADGDTHTVAQPVAVHKNGTLVATRKNVNLIEGSNVTLTVADDAGDDEVDVTIAAASGGGGAALELVHVRDEKASGTDGGTFTSGAWQTRTLNTVKTNEVTGASLASNEVTLPAGTYEIDASAPVLRVNNHQTRLFDVTGAAVLLVGTSEHNAATGSDGTNRSFVRGRFTLAAESAVRLEHRCVTTVATNGLGLACGFGTEVFADVMIRKVS